MPRTLLVCFVFTLMLATLPACDPTASSTSNGSSSGSDGRLTGKALDKEIETWLADGKADARAWLARGDTIIWEGDKDFTKQFVAEMHHHGAVEVLVVDPQYLDDDDPSRGQLANMFVVTLPDDPAKRQAVIDRFNHLLYSDLDPEDQKELVVIDEGQKYLLLEYD